jgi:hypothetical protein
MKLASYKARKRRERVCGQNRKGSGAEWDGGAPVRISFYTGEEEDRRRRETSREVHGQVGAAGLGSVDSFLPGLFTKGEQCKERGLTQAVVDPELWLVWKWKRK